MTSYELIGQSEDLEPDVAAAGSPRDGPAPGHRYFNATRSAIPKANTTTGAQKWLSVRMATNLDGFKTSPPGRTKDYIPWQPNCRLDLKPVRALRAVRHVAAGSEIRPYFTTRNPM